MKLSIKKSKLIAWSSAVLTVGALGVQSLQSSASAEEPAPVASSKPQKCRKVKMGASWSAYYSDVPQLRAHSDIGVAGWISDISPTYVPRTGPVYRMITVTVSDIVHQKYSNAYVPREITFMQSGGVYDETLYELEDDPLFAMDEDVLLYLEEYQSGRYRIAGGPTGRFRVIDNAVKPMLDHVKVPKDASLSSFKEF